MNTLEIVKAGIWGVCVADALGLPVQFKSRTYLEKNPVNDMIGYGTFNMPPGSWSDDGSLTLCIAESLSRGYNLDNIAHNFIEWYKNGKFTPFGSAYDVGGSTTNSVNRLINGISAYQSGDSKIETNGNGSLMRTLPLALYFYFKNTPDKDQYKIIKEVSAITHGHSLSVISCLIYIDLALLVLKGFSIEESLNQIKQNKNKYYNYLNQSEQSYFKNILENDLKTFSISQIKSSGFVIDSLEASLWCLLNSNNYKDTAIKAVNLGDDTDTIAAIACGIAALHYGYDSIPKTWIQTIVNGKEIDRVCELLANSFQ
ncbi:MAG TPA: ADP-ribosylglycohydrolase family protein [Leptospiraceae bacterium]|nr:ADP-ribosylglycohydrolase family protein [Leptospiraceae bacterium]HMX31434.1 ADP-ribosylglycohydrolase family protein [Leptospiraceae bacterium]HMY30927.1 ADP-ribosylglycohydrolase family protein [Leptospiraceae bacterium]HMZ63338.1 ADP-ribosylglycohydrolase family protein [Leptospiraceae bacterium]HNA05567.1 ADP-ribosylglycohydrolase family protein [Leptospiraceae bacterium]